MQNKKKSAKVNNKSMNRKRSKNDALLPDDSLTGFRIGDANSF